MDMRIAWPIYLVGAFLDFLILEVYALATGKQTLTQWTQVLVGVGSMRPTWWIAASLGALLLLWLWVHLFT
ncbi:MAG TPA: hypothetical protein VGX25_06730, partial [Actinophytocola sp.]|uniref:hypothetical protein n=1 Tax=Actinophytocola sp. TaxID=1872138 RepID=UPI002DDD3E0B